MSIKIVKLCRNHKPGFTLIEIMIVVGILVLIAGLGLPNLIRVRVLANDSKAAMNVRSIITAAHSYRGVNARYPESLEELGPAPGSASGGGGEPAYYCAAIAQPAFLDGTLGCIAGADGYCWKDGYRYWLKDPATAPVHDSRNSFVVKAKPIRFAWWAGQPPTGKRYFYADESGVIRYATKRLYPDYRINIENTIPLE